MRATEELMHEHKVIIKVLEAARIEAEKLTGKVSLNSSLAEKMLDFFRNFTDRCHHIKEENHLFPILEEKGMPHDNGPIAVMLSEHDEGRKLVSDISNLLPSASRNRRDAILTIAGKLAAYVNLLEGHIAKENEVLFPMADKLLSDEDQKRLETEFARVEEEETGKGIHEKYHDLAHEISDSILAE
jgi:hemerythrin-like domain-containing protein